MSSNDPVKFKKMVAQGECLFLRIKKIPASAKPQARKEGEPLTVSHSETGHNHVIVHGGAMIFECDPPDPFKCYLRVDAQDGVTLEHLRPWDTHKAIMFAPGDYEIRRDREMTPEGFVRVVND
jgi:hypothetical protein